MKIKLNCYPCILNMAAKLADLATFPLKEKTELMNYAMNLFLNQDEMALSTPPRIVGKIQAYAAKLAGGGPFDPYREIKKISNDIAMEYYDPLIEMVDKAPEPLAMAIRISAAGNIIDFGPKSFSEIDIHEEVRQIPGLDFGCFDYQQFKGRLKTSKNLLVIGDNAGEIVFDKLLIRQLSRDYPDLKIYFITRGRAVINDITLAEAAYVKMEEYATVLSSGSGCPGTILKQTTEEFQKLFYEADLILSKGQGNFESLGEESRAIFFLFRIKCPQVAEESGFPLNQLALWFKPAKAD